MDSSEDRDLATLEPVSRELAELLRAVEGPHLHRATPCDGWDLTGLIDHVVGGNWFSSQVLAGNTADAAMAKTMERFGGGSASIDDAIVSVDEQRADFNRQGALDETWSHIVGELTGRQMLRLRLHDLIIHTWDIGRALDPTVVVPDEFVLWGLTELADTDGVSDRPFLNGGVRVQDPCVVSYS